jgi:hypothetical protein
MNMNKQIPSCQSGHTRKTAFDILGHLGGGYLRSSGARVLSRQCRVDGSEASLALHFPQDGRQVVVISSGIDGYKLCGLAGEPLALRVVRDGVAARHLQSELQECLSLAAD